MITKEQVIEKMGDKDVSCSTQTEWDDCMYRLGRLGFDIYEPEPTDFNKFGSFCFSGNEISPIMVYNASIKATEFLTWFEEEPTKPKKRPSREVFQIELDALKTKFNCYYDESTILATWNGRDYEVNGHLSPEEAIVFSKWITDMEGVDE